MAIEVIKKAIKKVVEIAIIIITKLKLKEKY